MKLKILIVSVLVAIILSACGSVSTIEEESSM